MLKALKEALMGYIDGHSHLADLRLQSDLDQCLARAKASGISHFIQGGVGPEDWHRQLSLVARYPEIIACFGLHPYWVADHSATECEEALDLLAKLLPRSIGVGEVGLDFRPEIEKGSRERQITVMEAQMEMAHVAKKPLVFHFVRCFPEATSILRLWGVGERGGMVHSFNSGVEQAEAYLEMGLFLSVGGPAARANNRPLREALAMIPLEHLILETDSPDQPPPDLAGGLNEPSSLLTVAAAVAQIRGISASEVLDSSTRNLRKLFHL